MPRTANQSEDVRAAMAAMQLQFEAWIRETPEQWMWSNRRWRRTRQQPAGSGHLGDRLRVCTKSRTFTFARAAYLSSQVPAAFCPQLPTSPPMPSTRTPARFFAPLAIGAPEPWRAPPVRLERMIHFVPPHNEKIVSKIKDLAKQVDVVLGNLEDAIPADRKRDARAGFIKMAREFERDRRACGLASTA